MLDLDFNDQHAVLTFPQELLAEDFVQEFLAKLKAEMVHSKSQLTDDEILNLSESIQENWWQQYKPTVLEKIAKHNP
jgi:hypothetical protein